MVPPPKPGGQIRLNILDAGRYDTEGRYHKERKKYPKRDKNEMLNIGVTAVMNIIHLFFSQCKQSCPVDSNILFFLGFGQ